MKNLLNLISFLILLLTACSKTPIFPDPGLDAQMSVYDTVRRDTIDTYSYKMKVKSPNGIKVIQILDGHNYKLLEEVNSYAGQKEFEFLYNIDLKAIVDEDSTINRIIKVIDQDLRTYNKAFSLTVKPFSRPSIHFSEEGNVLGLENSSFELNMVFETGLNTIRSYKVELNGVVIDGGNIAGNLSLYNYKKVLDLSMVKDQLYDLKVSLTDNKGNTGQKVLKLKLIDVKRPVKVFVNTYSSGSPRLNQEWEFYYNKINPSRLDSIGTLFYSTVLVNGVSTQRVRPSNYYFSYNANGKVSAIEKWNVINEVWSREYRWTYGYDAQQRLLDVTSVDASLYNLRFGDWYPDGRVKTFANITDWPLTEVVPWHTLSSGGYATAEVRMISGRRSIAPKISSIVIPTYQEALPTFLPFNGLLEDFQVLTMWKYGFEWINNYDAAKGITFSKYLTENPRVEYSYSTNATGRLSKIVKKTVSTSGVRTAAREYVFVYE